MKKVTQIDYQILELESRSSKLSPIERLKLSNLKEQKTLMANQGIKMKASIVPRFFPPPRPTIPGDCSESSGSYVEPAEETFTKADDTSEKGTETSIQKLASTVLEEDEEIAVFEEDGENAGLEEDGESTGLEEAKKAILGEEFRKEIRINKLTEVEKKRRKAEADKKYKDNVRKEKSEEQKEQGSVKVKIEEMLSSKLEEMDQLKNYMENVKCEIQNTQKMKKDNIEQIVIKDLELMVLKEKFKVLHKVHKKCAKDYMENE